MDDRYFKNTLDDARRSTLAPDMRSPTMNFSASKHAPRVLPAEGRSNTWEIVSASSKAKYALRAGGKKQRLAIFTDFVEYRPDGGIGPTRRGALTIIPVELSDDASRVSATGLPIANRQLIDLLERLGTIVEATATGYKISGDGAARAHLDSESRVSAWSGLSTEPSTYLDHEAHPAVLANSLLGLFVGNPSRPGRADPSGPGLAAEASRAWGTGGLHTCGFADCTATGGPPPELAPLVGPDLDQYQARAVRLSLTSTACLIDGPPGTGKSQVVAAITASVVRDGGRVIVTSAVASALDVARRRLRGIKKLEGHVLVASPGDIAECPPPVIGEPDYDLVLIDECSRMSLAEAMPLLTRARAVVLIGDERQLRPDAPGETVLDRAIAIGVPRTTLRSHYRSQDRSLITPSNVLAYDLLLQTVPSVHIRPTDGLKLVELPSGRARSSAEGVVNHEEARAIVAKIASLRASGDRRSIGIVTANRAQQTLVTRLLGHLDADSHEEEPLFVRASHLVQGEERDIILISLLYDGRDPGDRWGLFDREGSVERLNVMLSRSRSEMWIFCSFQRTTPRQKSPPPRGRVTYEGLRAILDVLTEAENRHFTPDPAKCLERLLSMKVYNLGTVLAFHYQGDDVYRVGLVVTDDRKTDEHWGAIVRQLTAVGWTVVTVTRENLQLHQSSVVTMLQDAMREAAARRLSS